MRTNFIELLDGGPAWFEYLHALSEAKLEELLTRPWIKGEVRDEVQSVLNEKLADVVGGGRY